MIFLTLTIILAYNFIDEPDIVFGLYFLFLGLWPALYVLSRSRYYYYGIISLIGIVESFTIIVSTLSDPLYFKIAIPTLFLVMSMLLANQLISLYELVLLSAFNLLLFILGFYAEPNMYYSGEGLTALAVFITIIILVLITSYYRNQQMHKLDITVKQLEIAKQHAELASKVKNEFLAKMSHEIRTPLTVISGIIQALPEINNEPDKLKYYNMLQRSNDALLMLIEDILDISKIEANKVTVNPHSFDIEVMLYSIIEDYLPQAQSKKIDLSLNLSTEISQILIGDSFKLKQIITNLIDNGLKFTEKGSVTLIVTIKKQLENNMVLLQFIIEDTGIGIAARDQEQIFESFTQLSSFDSLTNQGVGLGLSIVNQLSRLIGGKISIQSNLGQGSKFSIELPFELPDHHELDNGFETKPDIYEHSSKQINSPLTILYADDYEENQELVQLLLKNHYNFEFVNNGQEAVEKYQTQQYDLILMDLRMPIMDGYTAVQFIRQWEKKHKISPVPIIAITAYAIDSELQKAIAIGCNATLTKPFSKNKLIKIIHQVL